MIREINEQQSMWRAAPNRISRMSKEEVRRLLGVDFHGIRFAGKKSYSAKDILNAPESFDSRTKWPNCASMKKIVEQDHCGAWALASIETMNDRYCVVHSEDVSLSLGDVFECSGCGGCTGGLPSCVWKYWTNTGIVTEACLPTEQDQGHCPNKCKNGDDWDASKHKGEKYYEVSGEENLMTEISTNGPVQVMFQVYTDFLTYSSGIYNHHAGSYEGSHTVKMIGYGAEGTIKYWICANSWGTGWGEQGFFRILRGTNECSIETGALAGISQ